MSKLDLIPIDQAQPQAQELLREIKNKLGKVPNIFAIMGHSNVALKAYMDFKAALSQGEINDRDAEIISLVVAQVNNCEYCLGAHTATSKMQGMSDEAILDIRRGKSADPRIQALIDLVAEIVRTRGKPSADAVDAFLAAGYSQAALIDVIGWISLNLYTNYFNHMAETPLDFPKAADVSHKSCCCS